MKPPLKTAQEALDVLLSKAKAVKEVEIVPMQEALGRVLACDQISQVSVPPENNTQMDGYVVRAQDISAIGVELPVSQRIPAGKVGVSLVAGTVARIFTGANIPLGADAVVMQEDCEVIGQPNEQGLGYSIRINHQPQSGEWVRLQGEDIQAGQAVLKQGTFLRAQELGVAASAGLAQLEVFRRVKVAVFFTGDELTLPGQPLKPGGIYNSNRDTILALLKSLGCEATDFGIVPDTLESTRQTLRQAAIGHDLIVTSGGVSVGEEDHIKPAVSAEGSLDMWQIAIKPGKPLAFGSIPKIADPGQTWFMGLPGNPVSSFVTFLLFVQPFIKALQGRPYRSRQRYPLKANFHWTKPDRRNEFLRVMLNDLGEVELFANQSSGVLTSAAWADGLIDVPAGQVIAPGDTVQFIPFSQFFN